MRAQYNLFLGAYCKGDAHNYVLDVFSLVSKTKYFFKYLKVVISPLCVLRDETVYSSLQQQQRFLNFKVNVMNSSALKKHYFFQGGILFDVTETS